MVRIIPMDRTLGDDDDYSIVGASFFERAGEDYNENNYLCFVDFVGHVA